MASEPIILSDPRMLAEFMRQSEFKSFFEKRFAVPPDYAALLFKNGQLIDAFKGGHFSVGGLVDRFKSLVGGSTHVSMMIADLKPFQVQTVLKAKSGDAVDIAGVATIELQVDPDKPSNILGMMHGISRAAGDGDTPGRKALAKSDVVQRIKGHLSDRVFEATIGRMDADEIRGNIGLQDKLQADAMEEVERILGDLGIMVRAVSIEWASNAEEERKQAHANAERQQEDVEFQLELAKRQAESVKDATAFSIATEMDVARLQNASEDELTQMALDSEIKFIDAREGAKRRQELEELEHQIEFLQKERVATFENAIANAQNQVELKEIEKKAFQLDTDMDAMRQLHMQEMKKSDAFSEAEITALVQKQQRTHISELQDIELRGEKVRFEMRRIERQDDQKHQLNVLTTQAKMTPEQILATQAGLSPDVAAVLAEQALASSNSGEERMALMREMVEAATAREIRTEAQALEMALIQGQGVVGVAAGPGGGTAQGPAGGTTQPAAQSAVDCPKCSTSNDATAKFCMKCGHKLRT